MYISYFPARVPTFNPAFIIVQLFLPVAALRYVTLKTCKDLGKSTILEKP